MLCSFVFGPDAFAGQELILLYIRWIINLWLQNRRLATRIQDEKLIFFFLSNSILISPIDLMNVFNEVSVSSESSVAFCGIFYAIIYSSNAVNDSLLCDVYKI